ncbi:hypothetical protein NDU88_005264 [Pleurodeles waltl]|uniref:Secreted protein n=1 Tax=Pleurodeles waltl TaxID=8319 RepID=A0AAV7RI08_PLEWA|nr:hypothetical protein NDU88_005264 [Pleurodeles waltl]
MRVSSWAISSVGSVSGLGTSEFPAVSSPSCTPAFSSALAVRVTSFVSSSCCASPRSPSSRFSLSLEPGNPGSWRRDPPPGCYGDGRRIPPTRANSASRRKLEPC